MSRAVRQQPGRCRRSVAALVAALVGASLVVLGLAGCAAPNPPMATVAQVDLARYLGRWYEVAHLPNRFQADCARDTQARYERDGDRLAVLNSCHTADGGLLQAQGIAEVQPDSGNARLRVSFFRPFWGDYWVLALDPGYRWALVGEPSRRFGWVLAREPSLAPAELAHILALAREQGYDIQRFVRTEQTDAAPR